MKIAILIPTMNRPSFIERLLRYYSNVKNNHVIYIGDSSNKKNLISNKKYVNLYKSKINIKYYKLKNKNDRQAISYLANKVTEDFCAFSGDDDYFVPNTLISCAKFLKKNKIYRTVQGRSIIFCVNDENKGNKISWANEYGLNNQSLENTAQKRLLTFSNNYWVPQFSVHRTKEFIEDSKVYKSITNKTFGELLHCFTFICNGKSKYIDKLYLFRQTHNKRYFLPEIERWTLSKDWKESHNIFINTIAKLIKKNDGLNLKDSKIYASYIFENYLNKEIKENKNNQNKKVKFTANLKKIKVLIILKKYILMATNLLYNNDRKISLYNLMRKKSPYYKEFNEIIKIFN